MMKEFCLKNEQKGMTLIELMIAMLLGLMILTGILQLFINSKDTYRMQEEAARLQENGRFALDFITRDQRMLNFWGCLINGLTDIQDHTAGIASSLQGTNNNTDNTDNIIDGTDTISLVGVSGTAYKHTGSLGNILTTADETALISISGTAKPSQLLLISDCDSGEILQADNAQGTDLIETYPNLDSTIREVFNTTYEIRTGTAGQAALYKDGNELIEGVSNLQLLYGEDTDADNIANYYVDASQIVSMANVVSIRTTLTASSTGNDLNVQRTFTSTVALRNRLP